MKSSSTISTPGKSFFCAMMVCLSALLFLSSNVWAVVADRFDYPIGNKGTYTEANDGDGWYDAQDFGEWNASYSKYHLGEDWNAETGGDTDFGLPVYAVANGTIVYADITNGWGRVLIVRHTLQDGSQVESLYAHLAAFSKTSGDVVSGDQIGTIGNGSEGGTTFSAHLHFEIRTAVCTKWGQPGPGYSVTAKPSGWVDPSDYIDSHRQIQSPGTILGAVGNESGSTTVDTRTGAQLNGLAIVGEQNIPSDASRDYHLMAHFADSSIIDVSASAKWSVNAVVLPPLTAFSANSLYAGHAETPRDILIVAKYIQPGGGAKTASMTVTIQPNFAVTFSYTRVFNDPWIGHDNWRVTFRAESSGPNGAAVQYDWGYDTDGVYNDGQGQTISHDFNGGRSYLIGVRATDSQGAQAIIQSIITLPKALNGSFDVETPAADLKSHSFCDVAGNTYMPDTDKATNGLIVIVHGMNDSATLLNAFGKNWMQEMGKAVVNRLGSASPNICLFDWSAMANPSLFDTGQSGDLLHDILTIRPYALPQGQILASWIRDQTRLGNIIEGRPIHIIGHSAGGFVVGECGTILGSTISQVTMLDTPAPVKRHFTDYPDVGLVERFISSQFGRMTDEFVTEDDSPVTCYLPHWYSWLDPTCRPLPSVPQSDHYYRYKIINADALRPSIPQHSNGHEWYRTNTIEKETAEGFYYSPFLNNGFHGASRASLLASAQSSKVSMMSETTPPDEPITGFPVFGSVTESNGVFTLTEGDDAGLAKQMTIPVGAQSLKFRFQFTSPGDGDFLAVYWGTNNPVLYIGLDLPLSRDAFLEADVPMEQFAGQSNQLAFVLTSRNETNAVLALDQIRFSMSDDPDGDGLTTTQEQSLGTDPLKYDSDGDGLPDGEEVNTYHSNPMLPDSDNDGLSDGMEITCGTNPTNELSAFKITGMLMSSNNTVDVQWSGATDRLYRVNCSTSLTSDAYTTLINNFPSNRFKASGQSAGVTNSSGFFWIEMDDLP